MRGHQLPSPVLILLFLLLPRDASATSKPQYLVVVPSQLYTGVPEKACVVLNHLNETVTLHVILENGTTARPSLQTWWQRRTPSTAAPSLLRLQKWVSLGRFFNSYFCFTDSRVAIFLSIHYCAGERANPGVHKEEANAHIKSREPCLCPDRQTHLQTRQTVKFRIVSVDVNFHPLNETFPAVYIENPKRNRIFQWQSLRLQGGLTQLSFPLSEEPTLGAYKVLVQKESGGKIEHSFEVNEYVLPKFEVQVKMPKTIGFLDETFVVSACGLYTYGKPVPGLVTINVCRKYTRFSSTCHGKHSQSICEEFSQQADSKGCFTQLVKTKLFQLRLKGYDMKLKVEAKVREEGTGLELTGHGSCEITNTLSKLVFTKMDSYYRPGIPIFGQVLLTDEKDQPIPNKTLVVHVGQMEYSHFTTNEHGLANMSIDTTNLTSSMIIVKVTYKQHSNCFDNWWLREIHPQAQHTVRHIYSPSKSYIHLETVADTIACGKTQEIQTHYILNGHILKDEKELNFYYLIKARGSISQSGIHVLPIEQGDTKGVFSFSFRVESDIAPSAQLLIYTVLPNGEIVADTQKLKIENCFANKVNLSFSSAKSLPASGINLKVTATPQSLCALRAVDQSMLLMKPEAELSPQSVYNLLPVKKDFNVQYDGFMNEDIEGCIIAEDIIHNGIIYTPKQILDDGDVYSIFESVGLNIFTNSKIHKPHFCQLLQDYTGSFMDRGAPRGGLPGSLARYTSAPYPMMREDLPAEGVKETVRNYFPETWIWDLVSLDSSGSSELAIKVPDTITKWKASALCLSGTTGLGLSPIISLQVFQPFFLELTLPYSVVRGEAFTLKATVFNYLSHCIRPEGIEKEETFNTLLCAPETGVPEKLSLKVPSNVVEGSARATYSVLGESPSPNEADVYHYSSSAWGLTIHGDILGSAMQNLQNLLQMPYGCGEQNMVLFVPNIYVLNYLNETRQLTENIKSKAISHLISGYQRQLNYKHNDGSYSTFGDRGGTSHGNTWLTAFVLKAFSQARSHIFVEDSHITNSLTWLSQKQKENGCFPALWITAKQCYEGDIFNIFLGGVDDEVTLSAYITIALLEMHCLSLYVLAHSLYLPLTNHPMVRNALFCLERAWESTSEAQESLVYTKALLAYAFALAGNQAKRSELLQSLDKEAVKEGDSIHWQRPGKLQEAEAFSYQPRAPSAEVEMTSYLLLAYLTAQPAPSSEDLSLASRIVKWITKQQNPTGGFSSTQDTVVALQALSKYGAATFTKREKAATVTVKSSQTFSEEFQVDDANRLLLQEVALPEIPGEYSTTVSGSGCVYLQTSLRYNILPKKEGKVPFALNVDTLPKNCNGVAAHRKFQIHINISYIGERPSSNMVIVDVKMVSGFIPVKPSVKKLQKQPQIQRTEVSTNHVLIYFEELTKEALSFSFSVEQDIQVDHLKPASVKAYDYYETEEFTIEEYSAPCSAGKVETEI
ncbi:hypothetical protein QTO34_017817 [Cnephaeus nilssonii]|uniref:Pregnancy zone protein-like n=1 Tax=Cnephaeus nilssonii TaxID=3371016 RepID=A0AA40I1P9_CNENI|nr:hypothetical protein QTO34_017817 [Eptesicus nilssonii]